MEVWSKHDSNLHVLSYGLVFANVKQDPRCSLTVQACNEHDIRSFWSTQRPAMSVFGKI